MKKFIFLFIMLFAFTVTANAEETVQGPGFDTDREAVEAYINAFIAGDISEILSTCAVDSYVDGYSLVKNAERIEFSEEDIEKTQKYVNLPEYYTCRNWQFANKVKYDIDLEDVKTV